MRRYSGWFPTRRDDVRLVGWTLRRVFSGPLYAAIAILAAFSSLLVIVVAQNLALVRDLVIFGPLPLENRLEILLYLFPFVGTGIEPTAGVGMVATSALVGVNVAILAYHVNEHGLSLAHGSGSVTGVVLGTMGAGCAACGAAVASAILGLVGAGGLIALLPFGGLEFVLAAVVFVPLSTFWLVKGIHYGEAEACPIELS
ncbi:hypothetical protein [Natrononativus amylolyticus]|uniref:hypothetical protein n=1 Tax=Natrononativus amylolyticus TaxID=2963434 RepID=UPI0020CDB643|nr:hypothetical protein [Natrononativus amylolyticus]